MTADDISDVQKLKQIGDITALVALFESEDAWDAVQALIELGDQAVPGLLNALLVYTSDDVCWRASQALGEIGLPGVPPAPIVTGLSSNKASVRRWSAQVLIKIGAGIDDPALRATAASSLFKCLSDSSKDVQQYAADALAGVAEQKDHEQIIANLLHNDGLVRRGVIAALGKIGTVSDVSPLLVSLQDSDYRVRMESATALGKICNEMIAPDQRPIVVAKLILCLKDYQFGVRWCAADALGEIGDASAIDSLTAATNDVDPYVRKRATLALQRIEDGLPW